MFTNKLTHLLDLRYFLSLLKSAIVHFLTATWFSLLSQGEPTNKIEILKTLPTNSRHLIDLNVRVNENRNKIMIDAENRE